MGIVNYVSTMLLVPLHEMSDKISGHVKSCLINSLIGIKPVLERKFEVWPSISGLAESTF